MRIKIITVGKVKEKFYRDAAGEYVKRLSRYCTLQLIEVTDEKIPDLASASLNDKIKETEGIRILKHISDRDYVVALAIQGTEFTSPDLATHIQKLGVNGCSQITFVIGGSIGLSSQVLQRADEKISFSKFTFPHQLMKVILLEQIYRCFRIINNEPYHK